MKISVIVPVYNVEAVLHYCLDSILNQVFDDFELILIDDGSSDNSGDICDKYAKSNRNVKSLHIPNSGVSKARNLGIEVAQGEYICFIDSDDCVSKDYLESLIQLKYKYPEIDNIWCGFQTVDGYDDYNVMQKIVFSSEEMITVSSYQSIMSLHEKWLDPVPVCKIYSRRIIQDYLLRFPKDLSLGEDLIFNLNYLDCTDGKIVILNKCLYNYTFLNQDSLSNKFYQDMFSIYKKINQVMYDKSVKWNCDDSEMVKYYNACFHKYEVVLKNTFHRNSPIKHKYKYNRLIMKSHEFKESFIKSNCFIHPLYRLGYKHCSYRIIRFLDVLYSIKLRFK